MTNNLRQERANRLARVLKSKGFEEAADHMREWCYAILEFSCEDRRVCTVSIDSVRIGEADYRVQVNWSAWGACNVETAVGFKETLEGALRLASVMDAVVIHLQPMSMD